MPAATGSSAPSASVRACWTALVWDMDGTLAVPVGWGAAPAEAPGAAGADHLVDDPAQLAPPDAGPTRDPGPRRDPTVSPRWVLHLDLDSFFASAEQLTRPTLRGRAVLVGGLGPRGIVAGASGEAKVHGARSAMPMTQARRLCPHATALPPRGVVYRALSRAFFEVVRAHAPALEQVGFDETFAEPPALVGADVETVRALAQQLRAEVRAATGLAVSVGAGAGKQIAKISSEAAKPDGVHVVAPGTERAVLDPLPVRALWGIGPVAEATLSRAGVTTVAALAALSPPEVAALLGPTIGAGLHRLAQGIDDRPVTERGDAKQVSAETTFDVDLSDETAVRRAVDALAVSAHRRLADSGRAARTVTVKVRSGAFVTTTRSETAATASSDAEVLGGVARRLAVAALPEAGVRLLGVSFAGLTSAVQGALFGDAPPGDPLPTDPLPTDPPYTDTVPAGQVDDDAGRGPAPSTGATAATAGPEAGTPAPAWRTGDDVAHAAHGHGWVQGGGHGRVTVRFETRSTGPGRARTFAAGDPDLAAADPVASLG